MDPKTDAMAAQASIQAKLDEQNELLRQHHQILTPLAAEVTRSMANGQSVTGSSSNSQIFKDLTARLDENLKCLRDILKVRASTTTELQAQAMLKTSGVRPSDSDREKNNRVASAEWAQPYQGNAQGRGHRRLREFDCDDESFDDVQSLGDDPSSNDCRESNVQVSGNHRNRNIVDDFNVERESASHAGEKRSRRELSEHDVPPPKGGRLTLPADAYSTNSSEARNEAVPQAMRSDDEVDAFYSALDALDEPDVTESSPDDEFVSDVPYEHADENELTPEDVADPDEQEEAADDDDDDDEDEDIVDQAMNMFFFAFDATDEDRDDFRAQVERRFKTGRTLDQFEEDVDNYCIGSWTAAAKKPGPCFFGKLRRHGGLKDGPTSTRGNCTFCKKFKMPSCYFVYLADDQLHTGYGQRNAEGTIPPGQDRVWTQQQPRTAGGSQVRWIVKKKKIRAGDDDPPPYPIGNGQTT